MKPIATGIYTFEKLIGNGCVYVDKTNLLLKLIESPGDCQYFMARPRRFGKSLAISTLQAIFEGRRELFKGLAIDGGDYKWEQFPVIRLDMSGAEAPTLDLFRSRLNMLLRRNADNLGLAVEMDEDPVANFDGLIYAAAGSTPSRKVVLLIDEYDKPLLDHLTRDSVDEFRAALKSFYSVVKRTESLQRFTFITGVSKFSKVSIFSDLNNLTDLTMRADMATLFGYTHEEVKKYFGEHIGALAEANGMTPEEAFGKAIEMYDGYRFHGKAERVVNPVSFGRCLSEKEFKSYWYQTGTPTFLVNMLKRRPVNISKLELGEDQLGSYEPANPAIEPLLFQTGYLTIESAQWYGDVQRIRLKFPNREVLNAFNTSLMPVYTGEDGIALANAQFRCVDALFADNLGEFFEAMKTFFASIPYDLTAGGGEQIWQTILYTTFTFIGVCIKTEVETNKGRIDAVIKCPQHIYVIEMKLDKSADDAIMQIRENGYAERYKADGRKITLIGINFSAEKREIAEWKAEQL